MDTAGFFSLFAENLRDSSWLEMLAVVFGILSVWFARKANLLVYPTGIISTTIFVYICWSIELYADMGINLFYTGMSLYGWYMWTRRDEEHRPPPIRWNRPKEQLTGLILIPVFYVIILGLIFLFKHDDHAYMSSYIPWVDSFTTSVFLIAMWLMARKRIENWIYWIAGNIISIPLYFIKGLVFTSFQFVVFLILAIMGLITWTRLLREDRAREQGSIGEIL